jgi:hypothetical protein
MLRRVLVLLIAAIAAIAGVIGAVALASDEGAPPVERAAKSACHPTAEGTLVRGRVLIGARDGHELTGYPGPHGRFAKVGLLVRTGTSVELATDPTGKVRLIGWATDNPEYVQTVDDSTTSDSAPIPTTGDCSDEWRFFAGGFTFKGKRCTILHVTVDGRTRNLDFGLDKSCKASANAKTTWHDLHRPLDLPGVVSGEPCPISPVDNRFDWEAINAFGGGGLGPGPAYPVLGSPPAGDFYAPTEVDPGWFGGKLFWYVSPRYRGRVLIRGAQIDGPGGMRFSASHHRLLKELRIGPGETVEWSGQPSHSRGVPSGTIVQDEGCYGVQIDGARFSRVVVFHSYR